MPRLWETQPDLPVALSEAEDGEQELIRAQYQALSVLKDVPTCPATPERIAWLTLWTKLFNLLDGARAAWRHGAVTTLVIQGRMAYECALHTIALLEPFPSSPDLEDAWSEVLDHLRAYTAWCLWGDKQYYEELLKPTTLAGVYDSDALRKLASSPFRDVFEVFFGDLGIMNEWEAVKSRTQGEFEAKQVLARVSAWLADRRLESWVSRLEQLQGKTQRPPSFFGLLERSGNLGVPGKLGSLNARWAYYPYQLGSLLVHGSSVEHFLTTANSCIEPAYSNVKYSTNSALGGILKPTGQINMALDALREHVWPA